MQLSVAMSTVTRSDSSQALPCVCPCMKERSGIVEQEKTIPTKRLLQNKTKGTGKRKKSQEFADSPIQTGITLSERDSDLATAFSPNTNTTLHSFERAPEGTPMEIEISCLDPLIVSEAAYGAHPRVSAAETLPYSGISFPANPGCDTVLQTISTGQLALEEVANVHPADFLALSKCEGTSTDTS